MKKIMFNDKYGLTEAVLSGRKTQTRRIIKRNQLFKRDPDGMWTDDEKKAWEKSVISESDFSNEEEMRTAFEWLKAHAPYKIGEIVAVAQSYRDAGFSPDIRQISTSISNFILEVPISCYPGWRNKMFIIPALMPHQIRIKNFRVERLQDISDEDCIKEGIIEMSNGIFNHFAFTENRNIANRIKDTPREAYAALIDKISSKGTWESNPFVFVYDSELVK